MKKGMTDSSYVMRRAVLSRLENQGSSLICPKCERSVELGDEVVSRSSGKPGGYTLRKIYHRACWESLFIDFS